MAMLSSGKQNTVPASIESYLVLMSTQQSTSTTQYVTVASHPTSHCAQLGLRPRQSVSAISTSDPLSSSVNVLTASSGMCQVFLLELWFLHSYRILCQRLVRSI